MAEIAIGVVSLTFDVFAGLVKSKARSIRGLYEPIRERVAEQ